MCLTSEEGRSKRAPSSRAGAAASAKSDVERRQLRSRHPTGWMAADHWTCSLASPFTC